MAKPLDITHHVRPHFPALASHDFIFADNAGGSQILQSSIDAITRYLVTSNVQLGGGYPHSREAAAQVDKGKEAAAVLTNVHGGPEQVVIGSSTTQLASNLGYACALAGKTRGLFEANDEIIISAAEHEGESCRLSPCRYPSDLSISQCRTLGQTRETAQPHHKVLDTDPATRFELALRPRIERIRP
jgi:selenocysteine lyase/cysteine desulfurase